MTARLLSLAALGLLACGTGPGGCAADPTVGYTAGSTYRDDVRTVAVPIFENDTFARDIEFELTDALIKEIEATTPYKVTDAARADTVLLGHIRSVELDNLSKSRLTGLNEEVIVSVSIDFVWRDFRTDAALIERRGFEGHAPFMASRPNSEPIEIGQFAVVQSLARDIVAEMRSNW